MTIAWKITNLNRRTADGYVTTAHFTATAQDGEYTASIYNTCSWPDAQPVTPYGELSEAQVLAWVWGSGVDKDAAEQALADMIEAQKNPPVSAGVPWA